MDRGGRELDGSSLTTGGCSKPAPSTPTAASLRGRCCCSARADAGDLVERWSLRTSIEGRWNEREDVLVVRLALVEHVCIIDLSPSYLHGHSL